ncbi:hypothetical protein [Ensifer sp. 1H6]|uniref:hypothetical protein n=1 Tax=Ensifer sp. 1H6 TaxID=1911585 RepID=UPI0009CD52CF|nr:hypothetical protein [Ensifer sp. 1H6]OMQ45875.1 hypothetical protein BKP54_05420 [Ensifer sp. 1H6]
MTVLTGLAEGLRIAVGNRACRRGVNRLVLDTGIVITTVDVFADTPAPAEASARPVKSGFGLTPS